MKVMQIGKKKRAVRWLMVIMACLFYVLMSEQVAFAQQEEPFSALLFYNEDINSELEGMLVPEFDVQIYMDSVSQNSVSTNDAQGMQASETEEIAAETASYSVPSEAIAYIRKQMVKRNTEFSFSYRFGTNKEETIRKQVAQLVKDAYEDLPEGAPNEGDYLYWHIRSAYSNVRSLGGGIYQVTLSFAYLSNSSQEQYVEKEVEKIVTKLSLKEKDKNDYEKIKAIYDYLIGRVEYDKSHYYSNPNYYPMYAAYSGLQDGYTVCQGYATLFYRICKTVGIPVRVIPGKGKSENHGWNIVKIGSYYYNVDATWDDEGNGTTYRYFLKSMADFPDHTRFADYQKESFLKQHVMTPKSYSFLQVTQNDLCVNNLSGLYVSELGDQIELAASNTKNKLLMFITPQSQTYPKMVSRMILKDGYSGTDVIYIDYCQSYGQGQETSKVKMNALRTVLGGYGVSAEILTSSAQTAALKFQYETMAGLSASQDCLYVLIDSNNQVRYCAGGIDGMQTLDEKLDAIKKEQQIGSKQETMKLTVSQKTNDSVSLVWNAVSGASEYVIYEKQSGSNEICLGSVSATKYLASIKNHGTYRFRVVALKEGVSIGRSDVKQISTKKKYLKKKTKVKTKQLKYTVLESSSKKRTVAVSGYVSKKDAHIVIPQSIRIDGMSYKVTQIGSKAFQKQTGLKTVLIGTNVTKIGDKVFDGCKKLEVIQVKSKKISKVGTKTFSSLNKKVRVSVPASKKATYKVLFKKKNLK